MRYKIGNSLRAIRDSFEADSDREAWEIGRAKVNEAMPTESGKGRYMELSRRERITAYDPALLDSGFTNIESMLSIWRTVYIGITGNEWSNHFPEALTNKGTEDHA